MSLNIFYKYRGVIVNFDSTAKPSTIGINPTKLNLAEQPWYHILVDGNQQVTYVAQSNLPMIQRTNQ